MPDNATLPATGEIIAAAEGSYGGDIAKAQVFGLVLVAGAEGARTIVDVSTLAPLPVRDLRAGLAITNLSGTITTGGVSQSLDVANAERRFFLFQNLSSGDLWVRMNGATAAPNQPSVRFAAGAVMLMDNGVPNGAMGVYGATAGQAFTCLSGV